jgi:hypothetical protein
MSEKSLVQKLSIKVGSQFLLVNPTSGYVALLGALPEGVRPLREANSAVAAIRVFITTKADLEAQLPHLKEVLAAKGMLWVSYHKSTSQMKTDINRDSTDDYANSLGLQGAAMISIDDDMAALHLKHIQVG